MDQKQSVQHFLDLIKRSHRGKFKIYIGMIAGVGKSYRMLQEAHQLLEVGVDVKIGYIETHGRPDTEALVSGLPVIARRKLFYKGKELEEMDLQGILNTHPEIVIVDELAHTNIEGSEHAKRWQDVLQILEAGTSVISAVNIQHIESLNEEVQRVSGIEIRERIPDSVLAMADEVVNIDLTAEELIKRLKDGKIYKPEKVQVALDNFFKEENILPETVREPFLFGRRHSGKIRGEKRLPDSTRSAEPGERKRVPAVARFPFRARGADKRRQRGKRTRFVFRRGSRPSQTLSIRLYGLRFPA